LRGFSGAPTAAPPPDLGAIVRGLAIVGYPLADEAFARVSIRFRRGAAGGCRGWMARCRVGNGTVGAAVGLAWLDWFRLGFRRELDGWLLADSLVWHIRLLAKSATDST